jgi:hypothetical protein
MTFTDELGGGIDGATISVIDPPTGLSFHSIIDFGDGNYSLTVSPILFGTYLITIQASRPNYQSGFDSFSLVVDQIDTSMISFNGTSDNISFGENYTIVYQYLNSTLIGVEGAVVEVVSVAPETGITFDSTMELANGIYSITIRPAMASTFTMVVQANLTNHVVQYATFTLSVSEIPTILSLDQTSWTISINQQHTVHLFYEDEATQGIEGAAIIILNPLTGLGFSAVTEVGLGEYAFTITPSETGTFTLALRATLGNYQNSTIGFTLIVTLIPTILESEGGVESQTVQFTETFGLELSYNRTDLNELIPSASIELIGASLENLDWVLIEGASHYILRLSSSTTGIWTFTIRASKTDHEPATMEFIFEIEEIETSINDVLVLEPLIVSREYEFSFSYLMSNSSPVLFAEIVIEREGADWFDVHLYSEGQYKTSLIPEGIGNYSILFTFSRDGFVRQTTTLSIVVERIPIRLVVADAVLNGMERRSKRLEIQLVEEDTNETVTDAIVTFSIIGSVNGKILSGTMTDIGNGTYNASVNLPHWQEEVYTISFEIDKENHRIVSETTLPFNIQINWQERELEIITTTAASTVGVVAFLVLGFVTRQMYRKRRRRANLEALAVKRRFEDVQNIIGITVLHKRSGLPIYTKIVKGGFDESIVSAFITAVTQFEEEFRMERQHDYFSVFSISDIIRVVPTKNLLCAFITVQRASLDQEEKMKEFARSIAFVFDDIYEEVPRRTIDESRMDIFDSIFDDCMDGVFLKRHVIIDYDDLPKRFKCAEERIPELDRESGYTLEELAHGMAACGIEETHVYKEILDALGKELIKSKEEEEPILFPETGFEEREE